MLKRVINGVRRRVESRIQNFILSAVVKRAPYDYVSLAYFKAAMEASDFFVEHMPLAEDLLCKADLLKFSVSKVKNDGLWLEFGVFQARDIRIISQHTQGKVYGFDSFEGLPEDWTFFQRKGRFSLAGGMPEVPDNVELVKGWFQDTLPKFLEARPDPVAFLHIDSDLYSSAQYVLSSLKDRIVSGTVILFDDFLNYPAWKEGEAKAFFEFIEESQKEFDYIGFASKQQAVAIRVK